MAVGLEYDAQKAYIKSGNGHIEQKSQIKITSQAALFHCANRAIRELTEPARPTTPSSKFAIPRAVAGIHKSQRSETSCVCAVFLSLGFH
jgi:hypothetical protein